MEATIYGLGFPKIKGTFLGLRVPSLQEREGLGIRDDSLSGFILGLGP